VAELPDFQKIQYAFAAWIRDPENAPLPDGCDKRRMSVYRRLFFNNLRNLLGGMFPVIRKILSDDEWAVLIRRFLREYRARTPYFLRLPGEFLAFLQEHYDLEDSDYPFLVELAHYEYMEIDLSISEARDDPAGIDAEGDLLTGAPVQSALCRLLAYSYPVHRISPSNLPATPATTPVFLAIYRNAEDEVCFMELNPVSAALLEAIASNESGRSGEEILRALAPRIGYADVDGLVRHGAAALQDLRREGILIGTRKSD